VLTRESVKKRLVYAFAIRREDYMAEKRKREDVAKKPKPKFSIIKVTLMLISAFLVFGGPTYLVYILNKLHIHYLITILIGLFSFAVGLIILTHLIKEQEEKKF
jgi:uncharacterized membrane protein SpoIIM required for sporulation